MKAVNLCLAFALLFLSCMLTSSSPQEQNPTQICQNTEGFEVISESVDNSQASDTSVNESEIEWSDIVISPDGSVYSGGVVDGKKEGLGREETVVGDRYDGEWEGGVKSGAGKYKWKDGRSYKGRCVQ